MFLLTFISEQGILNIGGDNMKNSICRFIPRNNALDSINTINFVLEKMPKQYTKPSAKAEYKMLYAVKGEGIFHTDTKKYKIITGDLFFCLPGVPYSIESGEDFEYMYITFVGIRANMIMDRLGINRNNFIFHDYSEIFDFWNSSLNVRTEVSDLRSESVLMYTFSVMGERLITQNGEKKITNTVSLIKKYIDDNFADSDFSLDKISTELSYNKKYISTVFKENFKIGISEYINTLRIQHACELMEQELTSIKDIAYLCGFTDASYFSRLFKNKMGISPSEHIIRLKEQQNPKNQA